MILKNIDQEIAQRVRDKKVLCILVAHNELTSDIPQFKTNKSGKELDFYNWRSRGFLTTKHKRKTVFFAEEDVLEYDGGMKVESILIHELAHVIHGAGFDKILQDHNIQECQTRACQMVLLVQVIPTRVPPQTTVPHSHTCQKA